MASYGAGKWVVDAGVAGQAVAAGELMGGTREYLTCIVTGSGATDIEISPDQGMTWVIVDTLDAVKQSADIYVSPGISIRPNSATGNTFYAR